MVTLDNGNLPGTEEMAQGLGSLASLLEGLSSSFQVTWLAITCYSPSGI